MQQDPGASQQHAAQRKPPHRLQTERRQEMHRLMERLGQADSVVIGAGSGLSTAAGYAYDGERLLRYFPDFVERYGFTDMYSGGFYPFDTPEEYWAYWSRYIWINRYGPMPSDLYQRLLRLVDGRDYFALTTNVDHCFQRAGFDKTRLFYTQGDYGLFQSSHPHGASAHRTYDNEDAVRRMVLSQGFSISPDGQLGIPDGGQLSMQVPQDLLPVCPDDGRPMVPNLRVDDTFVEDAGWHAAADRYAAFLRSHRDAHVLYRELGVGMNTPGIIKYPFWQLTAANPNATYACVSKGEAWCPEQIAGRSVCIDADIADVVRALG